MPDFKALIERIAENEGFPKDGRVYKCSEGVDTFGHGFTYITEEESLNIFIEIHTSQIYLFSIYIYWYLPND